MGPSKGHSLPPRYSVPVFIALVLAGLAGNYFAYDIFFNIQFVFGSIFAMLALLLLGLGPGVLAGALISSYTYVLWHHPYAIIIMTAEVLAVGVLARRGKNGFVAADALYWLAIGMPLVLLFYAGVMHMTLSSAVITMLKQSMNGIANALIARLLFTAVSFRRQTQPVSMREALFNLLVLFCLVPSLFLTARASRDELLDMEHSVQRGLLLSSLRTGQEIDAWLDHHVARIEHLAWLAATQPIAVMQKNLEHAREHDDDFLRVSLVDRNGLSAAFAPPVDELGRSNIGRSFRDRPYIPVMQRTLRPMLSEVVMGRIGVPKPMVTTLAPVVVRGRYNGYVAGILDFDRIDAVVAVICQGGSLPGLEYTILDRNGNVVVSSNKTLKRMTPFVREAGDVSKSNEVSLWLPPHLANVSGSDRWRGARYFIERPIGGISDWRLLLEQPMAPFQKTLYERYSAYLAWMFGILFGALAVAEMTSRGLVSVVDRLGMLSAGLPEKLAKGQTPSWPESRIREIRQLAVNMREMSDAIRGQFDEIRHSNVMLEQRIQERTEELTVSRERFRSLTESTSDWIWEVNEQGRYSYVSPRVRDLLGYEPAEVIGRTPFDLMAPEEARRVSAEFGSLVEARVPIVRLENINLHKDGHAVTLETSGVPVFDEGGRFAGYRGIDRDITERKQAEERLRQLAAEQHTILNTIPIGVAYAKERLLVWVNLAFEQMFGYSAGEAPGLAARTLYAKAQDYERVGREGYQTIGTGAVYATEILSARKDGSSFWLRLIAAAVNPKDVSEGVIWMMQDVTEQKRAADTLLRSEERLSRAQRVAKIGNWEWNVATNELVWSDEVYRLYGLDPARDKASYETVISTLAPECREGFSKDIEKALRGGAHFEGEYWIVRRDGERRYTHTVGEVARDASGQPVSMFGVVQDITERKQAEIALAASERKYRYLIENLQEGIWMIDRDGNTTYANGPLARMLGYSIDEMLGRHFFSFMDERGRTMAMQYLSRRREGITEQHEFEFIRKDGRRIYAEMTTSPILDQGGAYAGALAGMMDTTARKRAERDLMEKTVQLEDLTRSLEQRVASEIASRIKGEQVLIQQSKMAAMGEMLGAIAHQWRQPLNVLGLIIQNLEDAHAHGELDRAYLERTVQKAMTQIDRMSRTIDDFRSFFLPDKERTRFDVMQAVGEVFSLLSAQLVAGNISFRLACRDHGVCFTRVEDMAPCPDKTVTGFRNEFEHVIMNMVTNAREAIVEARASGRLAGNAMGQIVCEFRSADERLCIDVSDNGGGMPEEILDRIFEPYFTTKGPDKGTGLGLYMSKVIVEDHLQGRLSARNGEEGAVFTIELPRT